MFTRLTAFGCTRVSTDEQADCGTGIHAQASRIGDYCEQHGFALEGIHSDKGLSGRTSSNRSGLTKAIKDVSESGGVLVVFSLSRMARSTKDAICIVEQIEKSGAQLASISENIDTTSAAGRMFFRIMAVLAEFESDLVSERTPTSSASSLANGDAASEDSTVS